MPSNTDDADRSFADGRPTRETAGDESGPRPRANERSDTEGELRGGDREKTDSREFKERLRAVERAITDSEASIPDIADGATAAAEREAIESRLDDLESRVEELEAATQAIRGYIGSVRAVNREVERRADLALARASDGDGAAEANERTVTSDDGEQRTDATTPNEPIEGVPSDDALNAALPRDRHLEEAAASSVSERAEQDSVGRTDDDDRSWRNDALDRLRESI